MAELADPSGVFEHVIERKIRRHIVRRLQVAALIVVVVVGTVGGTVALGKVFHSNQSITPGGPTNGRIAFLSDRDFGEAGLALYSMNPDGTALTRLTQDPMRSSFVAWSPDGTMIAFTRAVAEGKGEVDVVNADGTGLRVLADLSQTYELAWSPDGSRIAFSAGGGYIYVMSADGSGAIQLTDPPNICGDEVPAWSPDSASIAFRRFCSEQDLGIYVMSADGSNVKRLTDTRVIDSGPAWSPDGTKIAFGSEGQIFVMDTNGTGRTQLTTTPDNFFPAWSPDGTKIAFTSNRDGNREIYSMNADGSDQTNLTNSPADDFAPAWQPVPLKPSSSREPTPTRTESSPSPSYPPECEATQVTGDFDGDGLPEVAVVERSVCTGDSEADFAVAIAWSGGSAGSAPLFDCQSTCAALDAVDLNTDGVDELAVLVDQGASTQFAEFYEVNASVEGPAFGRQAVLVAPPGAESFPSDKPAVFPLGGSVSHLDFLSCFQAEDGTSQVAADGAVLSSDQTEYAVHETAFALDMGLDSNYGRFVVQSTKDYVVPFDPNGQTQFQLPGMPCLSAGEGGAAASAPNASPATVFLSAGQWFDPPGDAQPQLTSEEAVDIFKAVDPEFDPPEDLAAQLGFYTAPVGDGTYRFNHRLAWGYSWHECAIPEHPVSPGTVLPCIRWLFLDANTGEMLEGTWQQGA
jgi:Tol biopolymer transport system component